jgi:hypothetical protein
MSEPAPLDLRALADVDTPEVVREALKAFRRRFWTRYIWIALVVALAGVSFISGTTPSDVRDRMEASSLRAFPTATWRIDGSTVALAEVSDLGDGTGLRFVIVPDPGVEVPGVSVLRSLATFDAGIYDTYLVIPKSSDGRLTFAVGPSGCVPECASGQTETTVDLETLGIPDQTWRAEG